MELYKRYVDMEVLMDQAGKMLPLAVYWMENGVTKRYEIDKIVSGPKRRASIVGGCGLKYEVMIQGQKRTLFLEKGDLTDSWKGRWFLESQKP